MEAVYSTENPGLRQKQIGVGAMYACKCFIGIEPGQFQGKDTEAYGTTDYEREVLQMQA